MMKKARKSIDNLEFSSGKGFLQVSVNPRIYPLDVVYYAAYVLIDRAYLVIGGDPKKEILVELRAKGAEDLELLGREFNNELINYSVYMRQSARNKKLREAILQRVLATNTGLEKGDESLLDTEGIAAPYRKDDRG